ncbi:MAG: RluA family pseudouridine synthase [Clostridiaceae bacterium]|nr:RluA family pseudouridine synthase [Clostridiaceae bacterium]
MKKVGGKVLVENKQTEDTILYEVQEQDHNKNIKEVLKQNLNISSRMLTKLKKAKSIFINNKYVKYHEPVKTGDRIQILMKEAPNQFQPQNIPFDIVYEDVDIIIINKQPGIVAHPTKSHPIGTVANAAAYYLMEKKIECRIRFVNRLDMNTSGLLILAKNAYAHHILSEQMKENQVEKKYITFVEGVLKKDEETIDLAIYRPTEDAIKRVVDPRGQRSITKYEVIERYENATMVQVQLFTGRTHQIRVHMAHLGHPLIGDDLYGEASDLINRQALHASYLSFLQPRFKKRIEVKANLLEDLNQLQSKLKFP